MEEKMNHKRVLFYDRTKAALEGIDLSPLKQMQVLRRKIGFTILARQKLKTIDGWYFWVSTVLRHPWPEYISEREWIDPPLTFFGRIKALFGARSSVETR
jgi:hypothetical protein